MRVGFRKRAAKHSEILREDVNQPAVHTAESGYKSIARGALRFHSEISAMVAHEFIQLFKGTFIEQQIDSFAGGQFSRFVFAFATLQSAAGFGFLAAMTQLCNAA